MSTLTLLLILKYTIVLDVIIIKPKIMVLWGIKPREISDLSLVVLCVLDQASTNFKLVSAMTPQNRKYLLTLTGFTLRLIM